MFNDLTLKKLDVSLGLSSEDFVDFNHFFDTFLHFEIFVLYNETVIFQVLELHQICDLKLNEL